MSSWLSCFAFRSRRRVELDMEIAQVNFCSPARRIWPVIIEFLFQSSHRQNICPWCSVLFIFGKIVDVGILCVACSSPVQRDGICGPWIVLRRGTHVAKRRHLSSLPFSFDERIWRGTWGSLAIIGKFQSCAAAFIVFDDLTSWSLHARNLRRRSQCPILPIGE